MTNKKIWWGVPGTDACTYLLDFKKGENEKGTKQRGGGGGGTLNVNATGSPTKT